jgi:hypothetical protein
MRSGKYKLHYLQKHLVEGASLVNGYVNPILQPKFTYGNVASTNFQITNTTDTSLSCGAESYYWEIVNYFEGFCGKNSNFTDGTGPSSKKSGFNFITPGTYYLRLTTRIPVE